MKLITNLGALLTLIYLYKQETNTLIANDSVWSKHLVNLWYALPSSLIFIVFLLYCIILLYNILENKKSILIYLISLYILGIGTSIGINTLSLEEVTNLGLFSVYHPVCLEDKIYFFKCELAHYQMLYNPEVYTSIESINYYKQIIDNLFMDFRILKSLDIKDISKLAKELASIKITCLDSPEVLVPIILTIFLLNCLMP